MTAGRNRRRNIVQPKSPKHLYVVAGLPASGRRAAMRWFETQFTAALAQSLVATAEDGLLYPDAYVRQMIHSVGAFAVRRRTKGGENPPAPATITLLYVPSEDDERLLEAFDFAVMAVPLARLVARDDKGRQLRHDGEAVAQSLAQATARDGEVRAAMHEVVRRLGRQRDDEPLLLPPRNFLLQDHDLVPVFRSFRRGEREWTDRGADLRPTALTRDDIARIPAQKTRRVFVDDRGMAFLIAHPKAFDGRAREVETEDDTAGILSVLRALYRFGGAIAPGLHHDAQRSDGTALGGAVFHCERKGSIRVEGDYVNIYPNDFIRISSA